MYTEDLLEENAMSVFEYDSVSVIGNHRGTFRGVPSFQFGDVFRKPCIGRPAEEAFEFRETNSTASGGANGFSNTNPSIPCCQQAQMTLGQGKWGAVLQPLG